MATYLIHINWTEQGIRTYRAVSPQVTPLQKTESLIREAMELTRCLRRC